MRIIKTKGISRDGCVYVGWLICGGAVVFDIDSAADLLFGCDELHAIGVMP